MNMDVLTGQKVEKEMLCLLNSIKMLVLKITKENPFLMVGIIVH
jgi:hypothetical protein